jgi:hypothetical protein
MATANTSNTVFDYTIQLTTIATQLSVIANNSTTIATQLSVIANNTLTVATNSLAVANNIKSMETAITTSIPEMNLHLNTIKTLASTTGIRIDEPWSWLSMSSVLDYSNQEGIDLEQARARMSALEKFQ